MAECDEKEEEIWQSTSFANQLDFIDHVLVIHVHASDFSRKFTRSIESSGEGLRDISVHDSRIKIGGGGIGHSSVRQVEIHSGDNCRRPSTLRMWWVRLFHKCITCRKSHSLREERTYLYRYIVFLELSMILIVTNTSG